MAGDLGQNSKPQPAKVAQPCCDDKMGKGGTAPNSTSFKGTHTKIVPGKNNTPR